MSPILLTKTFALAKKYWQVLAGLATALAFFIFKRNYDSNIKKDTIKEIENVAHETTAREQKTLSDASEAVVISHMSNPIPVDWAKFEQLSEKTNLSPKQKAAKDKFLKRVRRKN